MSTGSTKQRNRKREAQQTDLWQTASSSKKGRGDMATPPPVAAATRDAVWLWASLAVMTVAALLRFYALELKPMHHDEGVNGFFLTRLVREGIYQYDPANYHGPTLYYLALIPAYIQEMVLKIGMTTFAVRAIPALFGLATVWLVLYLRRYIGTFGALTAAALVAVSPGAVYNSRYFIHESLFVFFTLGIVVAALKYYETTQAVYLLLAFTSAALLFATKETAFISLGVLALATGVAWVIARFGGGRRPAPAAYGDGRAPTSTLGGFGGRERVLLLVLAGVALFVCINVLFYSSFFTYRKGVEGAIETFKIWTKTGTSDFHKKPPETYVIWLLKEEAPILVLAVLGAAWSVFERVKNRFAVFVAAWAFGMLAAYSLVPYKTPWLALNFVVPMAITGGYAIEKLSGRLRRRNAAASTSEWKRRAPGLAVGALAASVCLAQSVVLNFYQYDNDEYPYVYAHTRRGFSQLMNEVERLAARAGKGKETKIAVASPDYWPLPWYLREYKHTGFFGQVSAFSEPIVIGNQAQEAQLQTMLGNRYQRVGKYQLRPGVDLVLYASRDISTVP